MKKTARFLFHTALLCKCSNLDRNYMSGVSYFFIYLILIMIICQKSVIGLIVLSLLEYAVLI